MQLQYSLLKIEGTKKPNEYSAKHYLACCLPHEYFGRSKTTFRRSMWLQYSLLKIEGSKKRNEYNAKHCPACCQLRDNFRRNKSTFRRSMWLQYLLLKIEGTKKPNEYSAKHYPACYLHHDDFGKNKSTFRRTYRFHLQCWNVREERNQYEIPTKNNFVACFMISPAKSTDISEECISHIRLRRN
jgi:hypothetical protein